MKSLYESILNSTGAGKNFLKTYLMKEGWVYNEEHKTLRNREKYPDIENYLNCRDDDSIYVDIIVLGRLSRYAVVDLQDLKLVTDFWQASNDVKLTKHKDSISRRKMTEAYQALKKGLKLQLTTHI